MTSDILTSPFAFHFRFQFVHVCPNSLFFPDNMLQAPSRASTSTGPSYRGVSWDDQKGLRAGCAML